MLVGALHAPLGVGKELKTGSGNLVSAIMALAHFEVLLSREAPIVPRTDPSVKPGNHAEDSSCEDHQVQNDCRDYEHRVGSDFVENVFLNIVFGHFEIS
jgi:hypothetical protein